MSSMLLKTAVANDIEIAIQKEEKAGLSSRPTPEMDIETLKSDQGVIFKPEQQNENGENSPQNDNADAAHLSTTSLELVFREVSVQIGSKNVLSDVSGMASGGQILAIMGPSGGGKTTLLNTLAGRQAAVEGEITLNGIQLNKALKRKISYVLQEDVFFPNLTLRETLSFTAMLRLPDHLPHKDKMSRMDDVIDALDIRKCLETCMGDVWTRGLSGGEKKRASIACEMITDPNIIYLDEPTSGLDYSTSSSLVSTLKNVATRFKKTVVMTIHQPSSKIFFQFDKLLLMCEGKVAYYGDVKDVLDFFENLDMPVEPFMNPADFIVDKLKEGEEAREKIFTGARMLRSKDSWPSALRGTRVSSVKENSQNVDASEGQTTGGFFSKVKQFNMGSNRRTKNERVGQEDVEPGSVHVSLIDLEREDRFDGGPRWPTGFVTQYVQLVIRSFKQSKSRIFDKLKLAECLALCILVSLIWFQLPRTEETLRDKMGALFFISIHWGFTPLFDATSSFPAERVVIHKERAAGWYRLSAYYLAKMTSELPLIVVQPALFVTVAYWCIGLNGVGPFFATVFVVMVNSIAGQSVGLFVGILCMDFRRAMTAATVVMMSMMLLGGLYTRTLPVWLNWVKYLSFLHYSFHSLLLLEYTDADPIRCTQNVNASNFPSCMEPNVTHIEASEILEYYDINWTFAEYFLPLLLFIFILRTGGYLLLRFYHKSTSVQ